MNWVVEQFHSPSSEFLPLPESVTEVPLLLTAGQVEQLEQAARCRGLTIGQMLRQAVQVLLDTDSELPALPHPQSDGKRA